MKRSFSLFFFCVMWGQLVFSQGEITSSNGWTATIEITPINAVPQQNDCPWFYEYHVEFDYKITFEGEGDKQAFNARLYFNCTGGTGDEPFVNLGRIKGNEMGTFTTVNNARQYNANGQAYHYGNMPDCQEVDVYDINCTSVRLETSGNGVQNGSITFNTGSGPLPIELYEFTATVEDYGIVLKWTTLSELNNDFFLIEKSSNAEDWHIIKTVSGAGTTAASNTYSIVDTEQEGTTYYRLTQVDFDGKREVFDPIVVAPRNHRKMELPYPNPVDKFLFMPGLGDGKELRIVDISGMVINESLYRRNGESVDVRNLPDGIYLIDIIGDHNEGTFKVVVHHK